MNVLQFVYHQKLNLLLTYSFIRVMYVVSTLAWVLVFFLEVLGIFHAQK